MNASHMIRFFRLMTALALLASSVIIPTYSVQAGIGDLDSSFGTGGVVSFSLSSDMKAASDVVIQPDGKILAAGDSPDSGYQYGDLFVARRNSDGSPDTGFGTGGIKTVSFGTGWSNVEALALQSDGRIVAGGFLYTPPAINPTDPVGTRVSTLVRLCPDGSLDSGANCPELQPKFGIDGILRIQIEPADSNSSIHAIAFQPDGKIVVGGFRDGGINKHWFILMRFNPDGSLDPTFGINGKVTTDFAGLGPDQGNDEITDLTILEDGKILVAGRSITASWGDQFAVARYCPDGSLDDGVHCGGPGFGNAGKAPLPLTEYCSAFAMSVLPDGKILAAGMSDGFTLARLNPDGSLDGSFGMGGYVVTLLMSYWDLAYDLVVQADGKIILGGFAADASYTVEKMALARYNPDGSLDGSFGSGGISMPVVGTGNSALQAIALQADGNVIGVGKSVQGGAMMPTIVRFTAGSPNVAPVLDAAKSPTLNAINQDQDDPPAAGSTAGSTPVAQLVASGGALSNYSDGDGDPAGMALVGTGGSGAWWFSSDSGANWQTVGSVSASSALLLTADATTYLYYQNSAGTFTGTINAALTFRAWDGTSGSAGSRVSAATNGGTTAFSSATDSVNLNVLDNVAPFVSSVSVPANGSYTIGNNLDFTIQFNEAVVVNTLSGTPTLAVSLNSGSKTAAYVSGSGISALVFRYTVTGGDADPDGIAIGTLSLNGGSITDAASNPTQLGLNNVGSTAAVLVDTIAPAAPVVTSPANQFITNDATPTFSGSAEAYSTIRITVDDLLAGTAVTDGSGNWSATSSALVDGEHSLYATARDAAGNVSLNSTSVAFTVDTNPPGTPSISSPVNASYTNDSTPAISGTAEPGSTVTIILNSTPAGTAAASGAGSWSFVPPSALSDGPYDIQVQAADTAGNLSALSAPVRITIDTVSPDVVSITTLGANPSAAAGVEFQVQFSEPVTGVSTANFSLTTTGLSGSAILSVAGSGTTYTVSVDTGSGSGTLRLDVVDATGIADQAGNLLVGLPFTGQAYTMDRTASITLVSSANPSTYGNAVVLTASVAANLAAPTGQVSFYENGQLQTQKTLASGQAYLDLPLLSAGQHVFTAVYSGDDTFGSANSASLTQTVQKAEPTITLSASDSSSVYGQAVTYTAAVAHGSLTPTGTVTFSVDGVAHRTAALSNGSASITIDDLTAGSHTILAAYNGDDNFSTASDSLAQTVEKAAATLQLQDLSHSYDGMPHPAQAQTEPAGLNVAFTYDGAPTAPTNAGSYSVSAVVDDPNYAAAGSGTLTIAKKMLRVQAENQSRQQGEPNPEFSIRYSGFVNGEDASVLTGAPLLTTTAGLSSPVGQYPIISVPGSLSADNYSFRFYNGALTVHTPPALSSPIADVMVLVDQPFVFTLPTGTFTDPDANDILEYSAALSSGESLPGWLSFSQAGRSFSGVGSQPASLSIQVTATDLWGDTASDEFILRVQSRPVDTNQAPIAANDTIVTPADTPATFNVLLNDQDPDGDSLSVLSASAPSHGMLSFSPDGNMTYTPDRTYSGSDVIVYTIGDGQGAAGQAAVQITITAVPRPPVGLSDAAETQQNLPVNIPVLQNDLTGDSDAPGIGGLVQLPAHGQANINPNGTVTYQPDPGYTGSDQFTYQLAETASARQFSTGPRLPASTDPILVTVVVGKLDGEVLAAADEAATDQNTPVSIDVLVNDSAAGGEKQLLGVAAQPQHGTVQANPDGTILYTPDRGFSGQDQFSYNLGNGSLGFDTATVTVTVHAVDQVPHAANDQAVTAFNQAVEIDVLLNDSDAEDGVPGLLGASGAQHGSVSVDLDQDLVTYTPDPNFSGEDSFVYIVVDSSGGMNFALVTITIEEQPEYQLFFPFFVHQPG